MGDGGPVDPDQVDVEAAGFTIAPLLPKYASSAAEYRNLWSRLFLNGFGRHAFWGKCGREIAFSVPRGCCEEHVGASGDVHVVLRDQVEQSRFVIRPLSLLDMEQEQPKEELGAPAEKMERTATMLVYRDRDTLADAQMHRKEEKESETAVKQQPVQPSESPEFLGLFRNCQKKYWLSQEVPPLKFEAKSILLTRRRFQPSHV
eukprot:jgi/Picre1/34214/NNA_001688.t1